MVFEQELLLAGRVLLGGFFAISGLNHFMDTEQMSAWVESVGLPLPRLLVLFTGGQLLLGGLGVVAGAVPVVASGALISFLVVASPLMHNFWEMEGEEKQQHMVNFMKNFALAGGLLIFLAFIGSGNLGYAVGPLLA